MAATARALRSPRLAAHRIYTRSGLAEWIDQRVWNFDLRRRGNVRPSRRNSYVWTMQVRAIEQHRAGRSRALVTLLRCFDTPDPAIDKSWNAVARGGLTVRSVDVPHQHMLDADHVATVARHVLAACPWGRRPRRSREQVNLGPTSLLALGARRS